VKRAHHLNKRDLSPQQRGKIIYECQVFGKVHKQSGRDLSTGSERTKCVGGGGGGERGKQ